MRAPPPRERPSSGEISLWPVGLTASHGANRDPTSDVLLAKSTRGRASAGLIRTLLASEPFSSERVRILIDRIRATQTSIKLPRHPAWRRGARSRTSDEVQEFLTGARATRAERRLATVLFTDIVGSTTRASEVGDRRWRALLEDHHDAMRSVVERFDGRLVKTIGGGTLALFDGPARAVECAREAADDSTRLGVELRAGVHAGECELMGDDLGGIAVHVGARIAALAGPGEVLVSSTVKELVAGWELAFSDRGVHELKGVPAEWRIFTLA